MIRFVKVPQFGIKDKKANIDPKSIEGDYLQKESRAGISTIIMYQLEKWYLDLANILILQALSRGAFTEHSSIIIIAINIMLIHDHNPHQYSVMIFVKVPSLNIPPGIDFCHPPHRTEYLI